MTNRLHAQSGSDTAAEIANAIRPIASLLSKSKKSLQKLIPGTWQHARLLDRIAALHIAILLMDAERNNAGNFTHLELREGLSVIAGLIEECEKVTAKFSRGTSQHTMLLNRCNALSIAQILVGAELLKETGSRRNR